MSVPLPKMPWIQLGELDAASTLTPPPALFPEDITADQRAAMRFGVNGNAVCMWTWTNYFYSILTPILWIQLLAVQAC